MSEVPVLSDLTEGQRTFLQMADRRGVDAKLFGSYVPEIKFQEERPDLSKPTIMYGHTGGTLMMVPGQSGALTFEGAIDIPRVMEIADLIAGIRRRYNIIGIFLAQTDSKEVKPSLWTAMGATVQTMYDQIEGAVFGHGTHTLEYSAAASGYALQKTAIPVVLTASQIPILGHPGSDGLPNLTGAMEIAANGDLAECVAYADGQIFRGTRVTKKNDNRLDVFEARVTGPLGYLTAGGIELRPGARRREGKRKHELVFAPHFSPHVTAIKLQPGMNADAINAIVERRTDVGLILEVYGSGAVPKEMVPVIARYVQAGYPVFVSSACAESGIAPSMQGHDEDAIAARNAGVRNVGDMTTSAATVKLMHIMGNQPGLPLDEIGREMTGKSYAGELTVGQSGEDF
ncbi:MAG: asparaginase [Patescibacteria group bacterium]